MEFLKVAEEAARLAGDVLEQWKEKFTVSEKSRSNLVTEADFAAQETIFKYIHEKFPEHNFLGEEGLDQSYSKSGYRWIIDPLDGTSNYVHGFPYYSVSIALEKDAELIVGTIFDPNRNELFSAVAGCGATLNGRPIKTTSVTELKHAMVLASLPVGVSNKNDPAIERFVRVLPHVQTVQRTGSAALNLSYVAAGRIEAFWSTNLKPWDMAAGVVIVREAGGQVSQIDGASFQVFEPNLLSSNGASIHEQLAQLLVN